MNVQFLVDFNPRKRSKCGAEEGILGTTIAMIVKKKRSIGKSGKQKGMKKRGDENGRR